jgi:hypothetical protein
MGMQRFGHGSGWNKAASGTVQQGGKGNAQLFLGGICLDINIGKDKDLRSLNRMESKGCDFWGVPCLDLAVYLFFQSRLVDLRTLNSQVFTQRAWHLLFHGNEDWPLVAADNAMLVLPASADFLFIWDVATKAAEKVPLGPHVHQQELTAACWSLDGCQLAIGASKGALLIFDLTTKKIKHNLQGVHERVSSMTSGPEQTRRTLSSFTSQCIAVAACLPPACRSCKSLDSMTTMCQGTVLRHMHVGMAFRQSFVLWHMEPSLPLEARTRQWS